MNESSDNIYKRARMRRGYTVEYAAELLNVGERSLYSYESHIPNEHKNYPPNDVVGRMSNIYAADWLHAEHVRIAPDSTMKDYIPEKINAPLSNATLRFIDAFNGFDIDKQKIAQKIAKDDRVDDAEKKDFLEIKEIIMQLIKEGFTFVFADIEQ